MYSPPKVAPRKLLRHGMAIVGPGDLSVVNDPNARKRDKKESLKRMHNVLIHST